jgi:hypothetical protein
MPRILADTGNNAIGGNIIFHSRPLHLYFNVLPKRILATAFSAVPSDPARCRPEYAENQA